MGSPAELRTATEPYLIRYGVRGLQKEWKAVADDTAGAGRQGAFARHRIKAEMRRNHDRGNAHP